MSEHEHNWQFAQWTVRRSTQPNYYMEHDNRVMLFVCVCGQIKDVVPDISSYKDKDYFVAFG